MTEQARITKTELIEVQLEDINPTKVKLEAIEFKDRHLLWVAKNRA